MLQMLEMMALDNEKFYEKQLNYMEDCRSIVNEATQLALQTGELASSLHEKIRALEMQV